MPKNSAIYIIAILLIITVGFGFGYLKTLLAVKKPNESNSLDNLDKKVTEMSEMKLEAGAKLIYSTYYMGCGDKIVEEKHVDDKHIGLTKMELAEQEKDWVIEDFSPKEVKLQREVQGICKNHYYIGVQDGNVALFQGIPNIQSILLEKTDIIADTLRKDDREILERGLVIDDEQEFLKIREGLTN